ncbi:MAG: hypothetical protein PHU85_18215 [Phycisphaerae bacterium]|nr:hypothetical protein [Phycisphaerae bacterium]
MMELVGLILADGKAAPSQGWQPMHVIMLGFGVLLVGYFFMRMNRQRAMRQAGAGPTREDRARAARTADGIRDQLDALMVQLEELARATTAQIETRYTKLDVLLRQADERIAKLESLLAQANGQTPKPPATNGDAVRPEHRQIYELADAGRPPVEIAQETGRDVGEVELILALRKKS